MIPNNSSNLSDALKGQNFYNFSSVNSLNKKNSGK